MSSWMRKRRRGQENSPDLQEPLLQSEANNNAPQSADSKPSSHSNALVPRSINKMDWEDLWQTVIANCSEGFQCIWSTIRRCLCRWMPPVSHPQPIHLTQLQEERLESLRSRAQEPYDGEKQEHQDALRALWNLAFPGEPCTSLKCDRWKDMGWQQADPSSDFRGGGCIALHNLIWMATHRPALFGRLLHKSSGTRSEWEYPFAAAGVNVTFMLMDITGLREASFDGPITSPAGVGLCTLLADTDCAFEEAYCLAFAVLEREWLAMQASYTDFPAVLSRTRKQLEGALAASPCSALDLQNLLKLERSEL